MSEAHLAPEEVAPLLLELARAVRARRYYDPGDPRLRAALRRAIDLWTRSLAPNRELRIETREHGFVALPAGSPLRGPGIDELGALLGSHGVGEIRVVAGLEAEEIAILVEALCVASAPGPDFGRALHERGVHHITAAGTDAPSSRGGFRTKDSISPRNAAGHVYDTRSTNGEVDPDASSAAHRTTLDLVHRLGELESCDDLPSYHLLANQIELLVASLVAGKNFVDAYRAVLAYRRHAQVSQVRTERMREEARDRLRRLLRHSDLVDFVIEQACEASGLESVQATQVLVTEPGESVERIIGRYASGSAEGRSRATSVLIAMGDAALDPLLLELSSSDGNQARRMARLLGELQNPHSVPALMDLLQHAEPPLAREAARSLARIGTARAIDALICALSGPEDRAEAAATCLGECATSRRAFRALLDIAGGRKSSPDSVRREAIRSLGRLGMSEAVEGLREILDRNGFLQRRRLRELKVAAAQALGQIGGETAYRTLSDHSRGGDPAVRMACREALGHLEAASTSSSCPGTLR